MLGRIMGEAMVWKMTMPSLRGGNMTSTIVTQAGTELGKEA